MGVVYGLCFFFFFSPAVNFGIVMRLILPYILLWVQTRCWLHDPVMCQQVKKNMDVNTISPLFLHGIIWLPLPISYFSHHTQTVVCKLYSDQTSSCKSRSSFLNTDVSGIYFCNRLTGFHWYQALWPTKFIWKEIFHHSTWRCTCYFFILCPAVIIIAKRNERHKNSITKIFWLHQEA